MFTKRIYGIIFFFAIIPMTVSSKAFAKSDKYCSSINISSAIRQIEFEISGESRFERAKELSKELVNLGYDCISDDNIMRLSRLMNDKDDRVRIWVATILGNIGKRSRPAIPSLKLALAERACEGDGFSSTGSIIMALKEIGDRSYNPPCIIQK